MKKKKKINAILIMWSLWCDMNFVYHVNIFYLLDDDKYFFETILKM